MKKLILMLLLSPLVYSQNAPVEVASGLPGELSNLDFNGNYIYYTVASGNNQHIGRINFTNSSSLPETIYNNVDTPYGLTIHNNILYYSEMLPQKISKIDLLQSPFTSNQLPINFDNDYPSLSLRVYNDDLYYSETVMNIKKVPLSNLNQNPDLLITYTLHPFDFIKDGNFIYATEEGLGLNRLIRMNLLDTFPPEPFQICEIFEPRSLAKINNYMFVATNENKIYRVNLNQPNPTPELFYQPTDNVSYIGKIKNYNNELYFTYNEGNTSTNSYSGKIMKFSQSQLSYHSFNEVSNTSISPNPTKSIITVNNYKPEINVEIFDMTGKKLSISKIDDSSFDISTLQSGNYIVKLTSTMNNESKTIKIIKL